MIDDDQTKLRAGDRLGPGEILLLEAAERAINNHGRSDVDAALIAQARKKIPDPEIGTGGELAQPREASTYLFNTMDFPDFIAADASATRMHLAKEAGALALGVDTADTIKAGNSLELMLAHQIAAAHASTMRLMGQMTNMMIRQDTAVRTDDGANLRVTRLSGAASRMMLAFQQGVVTLDRIRAGGKQTIIVQHVQVNDGGQAVVAGKMKPNARGGGRGVATPGVPSAGRTSRKPGGKGRK